MYKSKKVLMLLAVLIFSASSLFAQSSGSAQADVTLTVVEALSISATGGDLDFAEVIGANGAINVSRAPELGAKFVVSGHASTPISVTFGDENLTAGTTTDLTFVPVVHANTTNTYASNVVTSGGSENLSATGELHLWVGGSITHSGADEGAYAGKVTISVAY